jgi:hypothetical protein
MRIAKSIVKCQRNRRVLRVVDWASVGTLIAIPSEDGEEAGRLNTLP